MLPPRPQSEADEYLDRLFDRVLTRLEDGLPVDDLPGLEIETRPDLAARAKEVVRLAHDVAVGQSRQPPTLGGYTILSELGAGGMGTVYLARQEQVAGRLVALKVLPRAPATAARSRRRFLSEARAIARLRHPNVVSIHDVVEDGGTLAYAMEWIDGGSLAAVIADGPVEAATVCRVGLAIAEGLAAAHAAGLLHRDVKPSNILLRSDGTALLADFGLVRDVCDIGATETGQFVGTAAYAAPEQLRGEPVDPRSDVFSLGATLYHALSGDVPYPGKSSAETLRRAETGVIAPLRRRGLRLPRDLETVIATAIDPDPARRYASADDFAADLRNVLELRPIQARRAGALRRVWKLLRRNRRAVVGVIAGGSAASAAAIALAGSLIWLPAQIERNRHDAHLSMLDPGQDERIFAAVNDLYIPGPPALPPTQAEAALAAYERLGLHRLLSDEDRVEYETVRFAHALSNGTTLPAASPTLRARAPDLPLRRRLAAPWRSPRLTSDMIASASALDRRCLGLLAFLGRDAGTCTTAWAALDLVGATDPLAHAALGHLYLCLERPDVAYRHASIAVEHFPDSGFLWLSAADAAVQLGQLDQARRWLECANELGQPAVYLSDHRIWADYHAACGADDLAEHGADGRKGYVYFFRARQTPTALDHYGRFLLDRERWRDAAHVYATAVTRRPDIREHHPRLIVAADCWWTSMGLRERYDVLQRAVAGEDNDLRRLLRCYVSSAERLATTEGGSLPQGWFDWRRLVPPARRSENLEESAPLPGWLPAVTLQGATVLDVALVMETIDMRHRDRFVLLVQVLTELQKHGAGERTRPTVVDVGRRWTTTRRLLPTLLAGLLLAPGSIADAQCVSVALHPDSGTAGDEFGNRIRVEGDTAFVGATALSGPGGVYVFERQPDASWQQTQLIEPDDGAADDRFGSLACDSTTLIIGASGWGGTWPNSRGKAYVYERSEGGTGPWVLTQPLLAGDGVVGDQFGEGLALSGDRLAINAAGVNEARGAVYIFERTGGSWSETHKITLADGNQFDQFGRLGLALIGDTLYAAGAPRSPGGVSGAGEVYVIDLSGPGWVIDQVLSATPPVAGGFFGTSISVDGARLAVGSASYSSGGPGAAYIFDRSGGTWTQTQMLSPSEGAGAPGDRMGDAVLLFGDTLLAGGAGDDGSAGSFYVFERLAGGTWCQRAKVMNPQPTPGTGFFGSSFFRDGTETWVACSGGDGATTDSGLVFRFPDISACSNLTADVDLNGVIDFSDVLKVLSAWGPCGAPAAECAAECPADINGDGTVAFSDLLLVLANWAAR